MPDPPQAKKRFEAITAEEFRQETGFPKIQFDPALDLIDEYALAIIQGNPEIESPQRVFEKAWEFMEKRKEFLEGKYSKGPPR